MTDFADPALALHGLAHALPDGWETAATAGGWRSGRFVLAHADHPRLVVTWRRSARAADIADTLDRAGRHVASERAGATCWSRRFEPDRGFACWRAHDGDRHVAVRRFAAGAVVWRQVAPGRERDLVDLVESADLVADDAPTTWRLHGLDLDLPPRWRLEGLQHVAGLVRALWCRYPRDGRAPDELLVVRRMACASRVLAGRGLGEWLATHARRRERATLHEADDGATLDGDAPGLTWWRRARGVRERRRLDAWLEPEGDRLVVQEWKGRGEPLPRLRRAVAASVRCA